MWSNSRRSRFGVRQACARACAQARLPAMVLISPLWASRRNGCASGQRGVVLQVRIQLHQPVGQDHALVADAGRRQAHHIEIAQLAQALFGAAPGQEQRALERGRIERAGRVDEDLFDPRHGRARQFAAGLQVGRYHAPAGDPHAFVAQGFVEGVAGALGGVGVVRQEHQAGGEVRARADVGLARDQAQEGVGMADQQAATVAAEAVGGDAAAMGHARQRFQGAVHQGAAGTIVELRDQPETAALPLVAGIVEPGGVRRTRKARTVLPGLHRISGTMSVPWIASSLPLRVVGWLVLPRSGRRRGCAALRRFPAFGCVLEFAS